tara:strand:+ start:614 stop:1405 length:792 start_codon:yes stop_codon:yes gene_type:complete
MAQAILSPLLENGYCEPEQVIGVVGKEESILASLENLPNGIQVVSSEDPKEVEVWRAPIKLLAVKPQQLDLVKEKCFQDLQNKEHQKPLLISVVAGVTLKKLQQIFPGHICIRAVPNTPVLVRAGLTGLSWGTGVNSQHRLLVKEIFSPISEILELPEKQLDAFLALTSSGPAYVALILEALADGAVAAGLPRLLANHLANSTLSGTALLLKEKDLHPGQLKDMVSSPGGTTITALRHLEMAGLRSALIEAVVVAAERSRELA